MIAMQDLAALQGAHFSQQRCKRNSETCLQKSEALSLRVDVVEEAVVAKEVFVEVSITQVSLVNPGLLFPVP